MSWKNPDPGATNVEKHHEFFHAVISDFDKAKKIIKNDPSVLELRDGVGETTLHYLAIENGVDEVKFLIEQGANVNTQEDFGVTPLCHAVSLEYSEMCQLLLNSGADLNISNELFDKPIFQISSCKKNTKEILNLLIKFGADINDRDFLGNTPLHNAVSWGNVTACKALLKQGADCMKKNDCDDIPFFEIMRDTPVEFAILLIENGTDLDYSNEFGKTLIHASVFAQNFEITEYLLKLGLSPHIKEEYGDTAWNNARKEWRGREKLKIFEPYL